MNDVQNGVQIHNSIKQLNNDQDIAHLLYLKKSDIKPNANKKHQKYAILVFSDGITEISGRKWNIGKNERFYEGWVYVEGKTYTYEDKLMIRVENLRRATGDEIKQLPAEKEEINSFVQIVAEITPFVQTIVNPAIKIIVEEVFSQVQKSYSVYPNLLTSFHKYRVGIGDFLIRMLHHAESLSRQHPTLNADLVYSGFLLSKLTQGLGYKGGDIAAASSFTTERNLIGPCSIMLNLISEIVIKHNLDSNDSLLNSLKSIILYEYQTLKGVPLELLAILDIDELDKKWTSLEERVLRAKPGTLLTVNESQQTTIWLPPKE